MVLSYWYPAVQGFFTIDVLSTLPWDIVLTNPSLGLVQLFKATKVIKLVRIVRVLKLVRILRLLKVLNLPRYRYLPVLHGYLHR